MRQVTPRMTPKPRILSFSLTDGSIALLRAISVANERSMSAEVRHMIRERAKFLLESNDLDPVHRNRIGELATQEEVIPPR